MGRPLLLDLFAGAGGSAMGYWRAGFDVVGIDVKAQPHYPFEFHQADVMDESWDLGGEFEPGGGPRVTLYTFGMRRVDAIHASPPCQAYTLMSQRPNQAATRATHPRLIEPLREMLRNTGLPYVIENVVGAPLLHPLLVCGSHFDPPLGVQRHRLFESNVALFRLPCRHELIPDPIGVFGSHPDGGRTWTRKDGHKPLRRAASLEEAQRVMGMDWADWQGVKEAVPPAYTEYVGGQLLQHLSVTVGGDDDG